VGQAVRKLGGGGVDTATVEAEAGGLPRFIFREERNWQGNNRN